jgi:hypothetical protein
LEGPAFRPNLAAAPAAPTGVGLDRHTLGASFLIVHSDIRATGSVVGQYASTRGQALATHAPQTVVSFPTFVT